MLETELRSGARIEDRNGVIGVVYTRFNPTGTPEPYWEVDHPESGKKTVILERRLLTSDYRLVE